MYYHELNYDEYDAYLVGPEWRGLNQFFYDNRTIYECNICGVREGLVLHKRSYKFLSLEALKKQYRGDNSKIMRYLHTFMSYLCRACHRKVHYLPNGTKTTMQYKCLREREMQLKKAVKRTGTKAQKFVKGKPTSQYLGSYFNNRIKK